MAKPEVWTGTISGAQTSSSVSYSGGAAHHHGKPGTVSINFGSSRHAHRGTASTTHHVNLLLDGRPVVFSSNQPAALRDGDRVVLGGKVSDGTLKATHYRNLTNGASGGGSATLLMVLGVIFVLVGLPFTLLLIGFVFVGIGGWLIYLSTRHTALKKMVDAAAATEGAAMPAAAAQAPPAAAPIVS